MSSIAGIVATQLSRENLRDEGRDKVPQGDDAAVESELSLRSDDGLVLSLEPKSLTMAFLEMEASSL